jgi:hypothetical protein
MHTFFRSYRNQYVVGDYQKNMAAIISTIQCKYGTTDFEANKAILILRHWNK